MFDGEMLLDGAGEAMLVLAVSEKMLQPLLLVCPAAAWSPDPALVS